MSLIDTLTTVATRFLPVLSILALGLATLGFINHFLRQRWHAQTGTQFRFQLIMLILTLITSLAVILVLPVSEVLRGQLLSLLGILLSAAIALSSTTFIGNMLAGIMLRVIKIARPGDFLTVMDITGRMTEMGLLRTEIQTEDRDLVTIPNMQMVTQPIKVVRASGTVVSAEVSLGYDISRVKVDALLCIAAEKAGLKDSFVQIRELGDFSVLYRVAGLLVDVTSLISARSKLRAAMLDTLHESGIEIVSPKFMNTRALTKSNRFIPQALVNANLATDTPEDIAFDKAELAAAVAEHKESLQEIEEQLNNVMHHVDGISIQQEKSLKAKKRRLEKQLQDLKLSVMDSDYF